MEFTANALRELVRDILHRLEPFVPYNEDIVELLMLTAAHETQLGKNMGSTTKLTQEYDEFDFDNTFDPADTLLGCRVGLFGMRTSRFEQVEKYCREHKPELLKVVETELEKADVAQNYPYQIMTALVFYNTRCKPIPEFYKGRKDKRLLSAYWQRHYRHKGVDTTTYKEATAHYRELCESIDVFR